MAKRLAVDQYVISVRRDRRDAVRAGWSDALRQINGVVVLGANDRRAQFTAPPEAVGHVRSRLGENFIVEAAVPHSFQR